MVGSLEEIENVEEEQDAVAGGPPLMTTTVEGVA